MKSKLFQGYKKLIVYQKSRELVLLTYKLTKPFPKEEMYVLLPQMRRAAISVMANIVEGYVKSTNEFIRFLNISIGSLTELEVFFEFAYDLKYVSKSDNEKVNNLVVETKKLLYSFERSLKRSRK
jgi:four helix bundle protein